MFHKPSANSGSSIEQEPVMKVPSSPIMSHKFGSTETLSVLSRSVTAASVNSSSTINTTFETNWMPNSFVVSKKRYKISLKLKTHEIELLRRSWAIVTSNEARANDTGGLERQGTRDSSVNGMKLAQTATNASSGSLTLNNTSTNNTTGGNLPASKAAVPSFNTAAFSSFLFCIQFYNNLIGMDPEIERLIPSIRHQASAFAGVVSVAISTLEDLSKMKESLLNLGHLHARILGIDPPYFKIMGEALIKTFQDWFGNSPESFPLELEEAWIKLYCFLANSIIQGGIDPMIEYNAIQPSRTQTGMDSKQQIDENDELNEEEEEAEDRLSHLQQSDMASSYASSSTANDISSKSQSKGSLGQSPYAKYDPLKSTSRSSYIPTVATKNINRLKKSRGEKEDCTIM